ncbi:MAG: hypothetical protein ACI9OJ_001025 [Myxococcota bacterium]|jgi:hypothetical protein
MRFSTPLLSVIVLVLLGSPSMGWAEPPAADKTSEEKVAKDSGKTAETRKDRSRRVPKKLLGTQELDELVVVGRIQKPEVFYVLGRTDFSYKGLTLKKSFVDRIKRSVRSNPF